MVIGLWQTPNPAKLRGLGSQHGRTATVLDLGRHRSPTVTSATRNARFVATQPHDRRHALGKPSRASTIRHRLSASWNIPIASRKSSTIGAPFSAQSVQKIPLSTEERGEPTKTRDRRTRERDTLVPKRSTTRQPRPWPPLDPWPPLPGRREHDGLPPCCQDQRPGSTPHGRTPTRRSQHARIRFRAAAPHFACIPAAF